jgi:hypothetical protein
MGRSDVHKMRSHLNVAHSGFVPLADWFEDTRSRMCPNCKLSITSVSKLCSLCRAASKRDKSPTVDVSLCPQPRKAPRADELPELQRTKVVPVPLGLNMAAVARGLPPIAEICLDAVSEQPVVASADLSTSLKAFVQAAQQHRVSEFAPFHLHDFLPNSSGMMPDSQQSTPNNGMGFSLGGDASLSFVSAASVLGGVSFSEQEGEALGAGVGEEEADGKHVDGRHTHESPVSARIHSHPHSHADTTAGEQKSEDDGSAIQELLSKTAGKRQPLGRPVVRHAPPPKSCLAGKRNVPRQDSLSHLPETPDVPSGHTKRPVKLEAKSALRAGSAFVSLLEVCKTDLPLFKRLPASVASSFATTWGQLLDEAVYSRSEAAWSEFFVFPKAIMWAPPRGGQRLAKKAKHGGAIASRLARWPAGRHELWQEAVERSRRRTLEPVSERKPHRSERAVVEALRLGDVSKALRLLNSAPIAPKTDATLQCLKKLHPAGINPSPVPPHEASSFSIDVIKTALSSFGPGSAAGLFGYKPLLLQQCLRAESSNFGPALKNAVDHLAAGKAPDFLRRFVAGGVAIALEKNQTSVRPLACGDPLRRLVAKCFCIGGKPEISRAFDGRNYGVGCPGGVEVVAHSLRDTLRRHAKSKYGLLKIDFRNAFNEVSREHFVRKTCEMFPMMSSWTAWCYGKPTMLLYDHQHIIESSSGVQQGDPLGPLYFCCGIMCLVNDINDLSPVYNKWYMDDGGIVADVEVLKKAWEIIKSRGPELGLHLNAAKCEWSWLDASCSLPCPIRLVGKKEEDQVKLIPTSEIQMLGVPLGSDAFTAAFVERKLFSRLRPTIDQLVAFEDSQSAMFLLRVSYSIVRAVHFMRTTPLAQWEDQGLKFDELVRKAAEDILAFPMSDEVYAQASLTPTLGGLGLRRTTEHASLAFSASWHESLKTAAEAWDRPAEVSTEHVPQKRASFHFDELMLQHLISEAPTERERQRLARVAQPHACGFITGVPSEEDGNDVLLRPRNFRVAVAYRLGIPLFNGEVKCPMCTQTIDVYGDHATCCAKAGDLIVRHNSVRNLMGKLATEGMLDPVLEKKGILGPTSGRRPGDVTIARWSHGKGLAIDVAVTSPFAKKALMSNSPCEDYARFQKHGKYDASFQGKDFLFATVVFETTGAINQEGAMVLSQLARFAAKMQGREFSSFCGRAWVRFSGNLQRSVSQAIMNRMDGSPLEAAELEHDELNNLDPRALPSVAADSLAASPVVSRLDPLAFVSPLPPPPCPPKLPQLSSAAHEFIPQNHFHHTSHLSTPRPHTCSSTCVCVGGYLEAGERRVC